MLDLENNDWIILDPLRKIYEIYTNLIVMTLFNHNHFRIAHKLKYVQKAHLCLLPLF